VIEARFDVTNSGGRLDPISRLPEAAVGGSEEIWSTSVDVKLGGVEVFAP
jgi:hypothetical protein